MGDWLTATAADLGRRIEAGKADPVELAEAFLDAIAKHPFAERIYARTTPERARAEALAARERARDGRRRSPLDGVPISWKDLYDTAGVGTEAGTALLKGRVPERDAEVLATATRGGTVCLGKTHMTELAFSGLGLNPSTASPPCIHDHEAVSGGSSSGAATSVAFGLAAAAMGSDTGGSIRIPAAWNDLVGFKPTHGRLSLEGVVPLCTRFDTVGPLTRTVEDTALAFAALAGERPVDLAGATLDGTRLMVLETVAFDEIRDTPRAGFDAAVDRLAAAGAGIVRGPMPFVEDAMALSGVLYTCEAYGTWRELIDATPDAMYAPVRDRFLAGRGFSGPDYVAAWRALDRHRAGWAAAVQAFDAVILPTCPIAPPNLERLSNDMEFFVSENLLTLRNTRIGNLMGVPGLTLPTGTPSAGIMFLGLPGSDARLLRLAAAAERALA
jgi:aspartyl-tRNA(Asn)/glutamyl-tRNA(Gln) amidotransferase subunit A